MAAAAEAVAAVPNHQVRNLHIDEDDEDSILFRSLPGGSGCTIFEGTADVGVLQQSVDVAVKVFPKEWFVGRPALKRKKQIKEEYLRLRAAAEAVEGGGICKVYGLSPSLKFSLLNIKNNNVLPCHEISLFVSFSAE